VTDIRTDGLSGAQMYQLLIGSVVPRPIAWITSRSEIGVINLAPFSAFTWVCHEPPMIGFGVSRRAGELKDTARNVMTHGTFVVNIADEPFLEALHSSSADYAPEISEAEMLNLALTESVTIDVPRLRDAPVALECAYVQALELGNARHQFMIGEVRSFHVRDDLYENGKINTAKLRPLARLAGPMYAHLGEIIRMQPAHTPDALASTRTP